MPDDSLVNYCWSQRLEDRIQVFTARPYSCICSRNLPLSRHHRLRDSSSHDEHSLRPCLSKTTRTHKAPGITINNRATHRANATKRQIIHMSIAIVVVFALCWLPAHVYHMILAIDLNLHFSLPPYILLTCNWCAHANSAINPWLLIYFKKRFRVVFRRMVTNPLNRIPFSSKMNASAKHQAPELVFIPATQVDQFTSSV